VTSVCPQLPRPPLRGPRAMQGSRQLGASEPASPSRSWHGPGKAPWKPWPGRGRLPDAEPLARTLGHDHSPPPPVHSAKFPPYFEQASPRGTLPHLNVHCAAAAGSSHAEAPAASGPWTSATLPTAASPGARRWQQTNRSLDSLFDTVRKHHRKSLDRGWCTERSHRLAREQRRFGSRIAPDRPPSVSSARLPGVNDRFHTYVHGHRHRTPATERSASERNGHGGCVTTQGRQALREDVIVPILDVCANSSYKELQSQAPPAVVALAGIAANRAVLEAYGAVEMMLSLAQSGKNVPTKLGAWESLHQLLLSSEAVVRFKELGGIAQAIENSAHPNARMKRMAAMTLERALSKCTLTLEQRVDRESIHALCKFVCCGDSLASASAGAALWSIAKHSVKELYTWPENSMLELAKALVRDMEMLEEPAPTGQTRASKFFKGCTLTIKALSLLLEKQKSAKFRLAKHDNMCLTMLYKSLAQTGALVGRMASDMDVYYVRAISTLIITTQSSSMPTDSELITWTTAALPRLLFILHDSMPTHWDDRRKRIARLGDGDDGILPEETEVQSGVAMIANRNSYCIPRIRRALAAEGFLSTLLELCVSLLGALAHVQREHLAERHFPRACTALLVSWWWDPRIARSYSVYLTMRLNIEIFPRHLLHQVRARQGEHSTERSKCPILFASRRRSARTICVRRNFWCESFSTQQTRVFMTGVCECEITVQGKGSCQVCLRVDARDRCVCSLFL